MIKRNNAKHKNINKVYFTLFFWTSIIKCAQPSPLIGIDFMRILAQDTPPQLKHYARHHKAAREQWQETIKSAAITLDKQWAAVRQSKNSTDIENNLQQTFEPIIRILDHHPHTDGANFDDSYKAIKQLFVDTYELSQKNMDVAAMLRDAASLPDNDDQLIIDLEESTILDLIKRDKLFSSPKNRMKLVTTYYLTPIDNLE